MWFIHKKHEMKSLEKKNLIESDVAIIWWWVTWSSLAYTLTAFTDVKKVVQLEKESSLGAVNSKSTHNSQTLHEGNIESNYNRAKAEKVSKKANILKKYLSNVLPADSDVYAKHHKMLIAVGDKEVQTLKDRYETIKDIFPEDRVLTWEEIAQYEPLVMKWRKTNENVVAHFSPDWYTVDFGKLSSSFIEQAQKTKQDVLDVLTNACVDTIEHVDWCYYVTLKDWRTIKSKALVVAAGWHTPLLLKEFHKKYPAVPFKYGDGSTELSVDDFSILSVAWSFFNTYKKWLNGKAYTMQDLDLPFAAIHWDPEVHNSNITRLGPTAIWIPKLERYKKWGMSEYFKVFEVSNKALAALWSVLSKNDWKTFKYLWKNMMYELPYIGKRLFVKEARKIIPTLTAADIDKARGVGWTRPQMMNTTKTDKKWLDFGEAKFTTLDNSALFTITPSPGATTCLWNAYNDVQAILKSFNGEYTFNKEAFEEMFVN